MNNIWKVDGKYSVREARKRAEELERKGCVCTFERTTGVLQYHKKGTRKQKPALRIHDYATQSYLKTKKREKFLERFKKLVVIWSICLLLVAGFQSWKDSPQANTISLANKEFVLEPNLSPVRFTPDELKMIEEKRQAYKKQYIQATLISTEKAKETETDDVLRAIEKASKQYGVSYDLMYRIAECESGFKPKVKNGHSTATGLYQYIQATWKGYVKQRGLDWTLEDRKDPYKSADMTAYVIKRGGLQNWNESKHCWNR